MATGSLDANGIWQYGEDDSNTTFSALLNRLGSSIGSTLKGRVVQTVSATTSTLVANTTTTLVSTGLTATITPKFATSKIVVLHSTNGISKYSAISTTSMKIVFRKNSTQLHSLSEFLMYGAPSDTYLPSISGTYVETAGSTTSRTFDIAFSREVSAGTAAVQRDSTTSSMLILEITA